MKQSNSRPTELTRRLIACVLSFGALSTDALAAMLSVEASAAEACILAGSEAGWVEEVRENLYVAKNGGIEAAGLNFRKWSKCTVSTNADHLHAIAAAVSSVRRRYGCELVGERGMRHKEWAAGRSIASARMPGGPVGARLPRLHRADFTARLADGRYVAVEVERTRKSWQHLLTILRAWTLARHVAYVIYVIPEDASQVRSDLKRAVAALGAVTAGKVTVVSSEAMQAGNAEVDAIFGRAVA
jgi:hypothetical protein